MPIRQSRLDDMLGFASGLRLIVAGMQAFVPAPSRTAGRTHANQHGVALAAHLSEAPVRQAGLDPVQPRYPITETGIGYRLRGRVMASEVTITRKLPPCPLCVEMGGWPPSLPPYRLIAAPS